MDLGETIRELDVQPNEEPVPVETPAREREEETEEVPA
jgi:hypothetical protein